MRSPNTRLSLVGFISINLNVFAIGLAFALLGGLNQISHSTHLGMSANIINTFCGHCEYKEACAQTLSAFANNPSANPKDIMQTVIQAAIQPLTMTMQKSASLSVGFSANTSQRMAMDDCHELLQDAVEELQSSASMVGAYDLKTIPDRQADLMNWLSAVISYQQTCLDGIPDMNLKNQISSGLTTANQLTSNSLAITSSMSSIFGFFKLPFTMSQGGLSSQFGFTKSHEAGGSHAQSSTSQAGLGGFSGFGGFGFGNVGSFGGNTHTERSLRESPIDHNSSTTVDSDPDSADKPEEDGAYPSWFSAADRRMLAAGGATPNAIVAKDGSGQYKTITEALAAYPKNHKGRYTIYVKAGIYNEWIIVTKKQVNVYMYGDGPRKTIVTNNKNFRDGVPTFRTATFAAIGSGFVAKSIGFQNTAGPAGHQAVALRVQSDMSAFFNCRMDGYQDTLYVQTHRQFYRNCVISGTVDFIFGDAAAVIQNSLIIVRKPDPNQRNAVTAQGRADKFQTTGIVIQNCRIVPEQKLYAERLKVPTYLGRPWKEYSRTVIMESMIGDLIQPAGWLEWSGNFALDTLHYREYANKGPGAATANRVKWKGYKVITDKQEALPFTPGRFIQGNFWLPNTGVPFFLGFKN